VQKRHYVLQSPADDASLAQKLVRALLGSPVEWPSEEPLKDVEGWIMPLLDKDTDADEEQQEGNDDDEDSDLEYFPGADGWGIHPPTPALANAPPMAVLQDGEDDVDAGETGSAAGADDGATTDDGADRGEGASAAAPSVLADAGVNADGRSSAPPLGGLSAASKEFTPATVDIALCLARTWNNGRGGQCARRASHGRRFCGHHNEENSREHGALDEEIPEGKLAEFRSHRKMDTTQARKMCPATADGEE